jgi:hypothetical protein
MNAALPMEVRIAHYAGDHRRYLLRRRRCRNTSQIGGSLGIALGSNNIGVIGPSAFYAKRRCTSPRPPPSKRRRPRG